MNNYEEKAANAIISYCRRGRDHGCKATEFWNDKSGSCFQKWKWGPLRSKPHSVFFVLFCFVFGEKAVITNDFSRLTLQGVVLSCRHAVTVMGTLFAVTSFLSISIYSWRTFLFTWAFEILAMDFRQTPDSQWHLAACFLTVGTLVTAQHFIKMSHRKSLNVTIDRPL